MNNFLQFARFLLSPRLHLFILWCFPPPCHQFIMNSNQNFVPLRMSYLTISLAIYTQLYSRLQDSPTLSVRTSFCSSVSSISVKKLVLSEVMSSDLLGYWCSGLFFLSILTPPYWSWNEANLCCTFTQSGVCDWVL